MRNTRIIGRRLPTTKSLSSNKSARAKSVGSQPQPTTPARSVPISLYRELSADLQASQANISALQSQNYQLTEQNLQLRQELEQLAVQTQVIVQQFKQSESANDETLRLDELGFDAESAENRSQMLDQLYRSMPDYAPEDVVGMDDTNAFPSAPWSGMSLPTMPRFNMPQVKRPQRLTGQAQNPMRMQASASEAELSGWKLTLVMGLIIFSAFGAGFLIVRPLLAPTNTSR
ncbi:hypothetical protein IQ266_01960 [filamentous cyanobacterium LEGE 11480]|uniref:Uncharacterized protein n=1 Tax=Romeriopsis navalis LEGE 11480 TaxID=2777977 RepID=A0A928VH49_9CYAN|nr:hypothetical protein [Romeriopsis navalis]MBE9028521.1 hypothetical protein [Romeriopsis navalis LEGE 11480]